MISGEKIREQILAGAGKAQELLKERGETLTTAESCTGGMLAAYVTSVPGASAVYPGGFVTYSAGQKAAMLGIPEEDLAAWGIVSKETAAAMAAGAAGKTGADAALSVTGNAGPDRLEDKPVGLVYIGCAYRGNVCAREYHFSGSRQEIRLLTAEAAFRLLLECMEEEH
ncbi:MAG: CinA family protein [Lachnospiraceae bacterium]|nr:CinA family protein [Lachnospiraceae bacterium]